MLVVRNVAAQTTTKRCVGTRPNDCGCSMYLRLLVVSPNKPFIILLIHEAGLSISTIYDSTTQCRQAPMLICRR